MIMNQSVATMRQDEEDIPDNYILDDIISPDFLSPGATLIFKNKKISML